MTQDIYLTSKDLEEAKKCGLTINVNMADDQVTIKNLSPMYTYLYFAYKYAHIGQEKYPKNSITIHFGDQGTSSR